MSNQLPGTPACLPPFSVDPACAAAATAAWVAANLIADTAYTADELLADTDLATRLATWAAFVQPSGWSEARWTRRKLRLRQTAYSLHDMAMKRAFDDREADYEEANTAYVLAAVACCTT